MSIALHDKEEINYVTDEEEKAPQTCIGFSRVPRPNKQKF